MENLLPPEIKLNIFSRLPAESVLQCRQVCKTWKTLLHLPHFAQMHLERSMQPDKVGILYVNGKYDDYVKELYYGEYDENDEQPYKKTLKRINHYLFNVFDSVVGSCNGLICLSNNRSRYHVESIFICNPITREYVNVPNYTMDRVPMVHGFGWLPSTNEYKVVRIIFRGFSPKADPLESDGFAQVYTLGGCSGWRNKGGTNYLWHGYGILANGALYWLSLGQTEIVAFDLADEEFHLLPLPPDFVFGNGSFSQLKVLGGLLYFVHYKGDENIDFWSLKKNNNTSYVMKEQEYQSWSWHKEFSIAWEGLVTHNHDVFAFAKTGEVLLWDNQEISSPDSNNHRHSNLSRYDPKTATLRNLDTGMHFLQVMPHLNSFISLKALGEEDAKEIRLYGEGLLESEVSEAHSTVKHFSSTP